MKEGNPRYGSDEIAKFANPENWEIWDVPEGAKEVLYQTFPEFTCLCPRSSYPDFATIHLITIPDRKVLELKNLKLWLNSYRDKPISHENATHEIIQTLADKLELAYGFILMEYTPRGNLTTFPMKEIVTLKVKTAPFQEALETAQLAKKILLEKVLTGSRWTR